jgi:hypothetical protein
VAHLQRAFAGLAHDGERVGQHGVERLAVGDAAFQLGGLVAQRFIGKGGDRRFERVDIANDLRVLLQQALIAAAEKCG